MPKKNEVPQNEEPATPQSLLAHVRRRSLTTQRHIAENLDITASAVCQMEALDRSPRLDTLRKFLANCNSIKWGIMIEYANGKVEWLDLSDPSTPATEDSIQELRKGRYPTNGNE